LCERKDAYRVLVEKHEGKIILERRRRKCEDNIRMNLEGIDWKGVDWIDQFQDRDK
jgi:hypothetical protein